MRSRPLSFMFQPRSVACLGASERPGTVGYTLARNLVTAGFAGPIWLVNPKHSELLGQPCLRDVAALPEAPELAVLATPPASIGPLLDQLGARGTRAAVVITAGLDDAQHAAMLAAVRRHGMRMVGPNCLGILAPGVGLNASFAQAHAKPGELALVSQSGAVATSVLDWANSRGIGFSHIVSLGNMADVDAADMLDHLAGEGGVRSILLYLEGLRDARHFMSAARTAARIKPVVAIKAGRHPEAARAAKSHTGALAGSDAVYDAAFDRAGVLRVLRLEELFTSVEVLSRVRDVGGNRVAILTNGGGVGILAVDRLKDLRGRLAELEPKTLARLNEVLPASWSGANPVDIVGDAGPDRYRAALEILLDDESCDAILVLNCPTAIASSTENAEAVIATLAAAGGRRGKPAVFTCWLGDGSASAARDRFEAAGIPTFPAPAAAVEGILLAAEHHFRLEQLARMPAALSGPIRKDRAAARALVRQALAEGRSLLRESEAKAVLSAYGIPVAETRMAATPEEVAAEVEAIIARHGPGTRSVVKISSRDISHKSDVGGVRLNILSGSEGAAVARSILETAARLQPGARIDGFMVQPMIERARAHELIVGLAGDSTFGPVILFGAGGTGVEVINDRALTLPPLDAENAERLIARTRVSRLLAGYRDRPAANREAIVRTLVAVSELAAECPEIAELDINPLLADETGVIALDARIIAAASDAEGANQRFAIRPYPFEWEGAEERIGALGVRIRPIRPEDRALYGAFLAKITAEDLRLRLLAPVRTLSDAFLARLTQIDYAREMAFVALEATTGELLGVSRLVADPSDEGAEYAVIVRSDLKGHGLGWALMQRLIAFAREEKLSRLYGHVLAENQTMLGMCERLGFRIEPAPDDGRLRLASLDLAPSQVAAVLA